MIIKEAIREKQLIERYVEVSPEVSGCDECAVEIKDYPNETSRLQLTVFYNDSSSDHLHFCSWKCVFKHLPKIQTDHFISLPFVHCDVKGIRSKEELDNLIQ